MHIVERYRVYTSVSSYP